MHLNINLINASVAVSGNQDFNDSRPTSTVTALEGLSSDTFSIFTSPPPFKLTPTSSVPLAEMITTPTISAETSVTVVSPTTCAVI